MCQLLGVNCNKEVDIDVSLREFQQRAPSNPHGWGFAFFNNGNWNIIKKPESLENQNLNEKYFKFKSKVIIGHVRFKSCGEAAHQNTHPFQIKNFVFAHNGTLYNFKNLILKKYFPEGSTDSEHSFCYLLENIENDMSHKTIEKVANEINKLGTFNFLLSDGKFLYAYGDSSLFYVKRKSPFAKVVLTDLNYEVNLAEIKSKDEKAVIVATEPLTRNENWQRIKGLMVFENGEEV